MNTTPKRRNAKAEIADHCRELGDAGVPVMVTHELHEPDQPIVVYIRDKNGEPFPSYRKAADYLAQAVNFLT